MTTDSRTALITGASSGLGAAIALEMASRGWKIAIGARRSDRLADTAEKAKGQGAAIDAIELQPAVPRHPERRSR